MNEPQPSAGQPAALENVTGRRIVAGLIDIVLLGIVFLVIAAVFGDLETSSDDEGAGFSANLGTLGTIVYAAAFIAYYAIWESSTGQSLGKIVMGLRVVALDGPLTPGKALIRTVLRIIDGLPVLYLLGLVLVAATPKHQRLGDLAAGTIIVRAG